MVALVVFLGAVALVSWRQPAVDPVAAAQPSTTSDAPASSGSPPAPAPTREVAGGGDAPAEAPAYPDPLASIVPDAVPAATAPPPDAAPAVPAALDRKLQARLDKLRSKYAIPGVSATIILADGSTWTGTSGMSNVRKGTKVKPDTAFALASVSKTYTAALILALANDGKLDLDEHVSKLLPKMRFASKVTVRQLLNHTSGVPDFVLTPLTGLYAGDRFRAWRPRVRTTH